MQTSQIVARALGTQPIPVYPETSSLIRVAALPKERSHMTSSRENDFILL